jgi:uncharacterized protein YndB with AHSA1/START domain
MPDRIEKKVLLPASRERVWRAVSDSAEFGRWFGMAVDGPFVAGKVLKARIVPTTADAEVAKAQKPYEGMAFDFIVDTVEPMRGIAFRWHPFAVKPGVDYSKEPTTLITFELADAPQAGTLLTITETGFDRLPPERRAEAFKANEGGWEMQTQLIAKHLAR